MSDLNKVSSGVTSYDLDDGAVVFVEHTRELLRLNSTGAVIWHGLRAGLPFQEIVSSLVYATGAPDVAIRRDVAALIKDLENVGVLHTNEIARRGGSPIDTAEPNLAAIRPLRRYENSQFREYEPAERCYQLVDFRFSLRTPTDSIGCEAGRLFSHLRLSDSSAAGGVVVEVVQDKNDWLLLYDDTVVDQCSSPSAVIPMLHANLLLTAYRTSDCKAAIHAAAVIRDDMCVLMPGASGSGKTTLTAAALAHDFRYCGDDLILLTDEPIRMRPVPTCLGLKSGSWNVLSGLFPGIHNLPTHTRSDGKQIRYLSPGHSIAPNYNSHTVTFLVFPVWTPGSVPKIQKIGPAEALAKVAASGYDLPNRIINQVVASLIRYISGMRCYEFLYDSIDDAVRALSELL